MRFRFTMYVLAVPSVTSMRLSRHRSATSVSVFAETRSGSTRAQVGDAHLRELAPDPRRPCVRVGLARERAPVAASSTPAAERPLEQILLLAREPERLGIRPHDGIDLMA
jgi:hypothetical protein